MLIQELKDAMADIDILVSASHVKV
jgi:hypothetical protein